jgi:Mn-dependent DtxR family transcriptional regulator
MSSSASSTVTPSLAMIRLLEGFRGKSVPVGFVAHELGLDDEVVRQRLKDLANQKVVTLDGDSVAITK